ncbi:hypothetical protein DXG01_013084, partial [Tephrocybe rancida]
MPPADNNLIAQPVLDGKKPSVGKRIFDRVKGSKSTKSSSASSTAATQSMENLTGKRPSRRFHVAWRLNGPISAPDGKLSAVKRLLAPFKGFKSNKSSFAQNTPATQSVKNLAALGASAAHLAVNIGTVIAPPAPEADLSTQVITATAPTSSINVDQGSSSTAIPSLIVSQTALATNPVSLTNTNQSAPPGPNVPRDQSKFKGQTASDLTAHVLTVNCPAEGVNVVLDGCLTVLRVAKEASEWNPVLKAALGGIVAVIDLAKTVSDNSQDMKDTLVHIQGLLPILKTSAKWLEGGKDGFGKGNNLLAFAITMQTQLGEVQQMQSHGLFRHVLQGPKDADTLLDVCKKISEALEQFKVAFLVAIEHDTSTTRQRAELHKLQTSPTAAHTAHIESDTIDRRTCTLGTRLGVLKAEALEKDSRLAYATLEMQLKQMLIQPWEASAPDRVGLPPLIVVVDALDENRSGSEFLQHLLQAVAATQL